MDTDVQHAFRKMDFRFGQFKRRAIMRKGFLLLALTTFIFFGAISYAGPQLQKPVKALPASPPASPPPKPAATPSPPAPLATLTLSAPNGGESWVIGSTRNITWTSSNVTGLVDIGLYRGGTNSQNRIGTIRTFVAVSDKTYAWKVGSYTMNTPGTASPGNNYWIVIKGVDAPSMSDASNGPFTLMASTASPSAPTPLLSTDKKELSKIPFGIKSLSLTYPRRADGFHKGIQYKITWNSLNLNDAKLKLELLDNQETTVIQNIAENFENKGEKLWDVPMTLPDEQKLYKIRIQTMDGAKSDTVGPIKIAKGATPAGPPTLKVTNPTVGDRAVGDTVPIKWNSYTTCSALADGPLSDVFRIDLMNEAGNAKVMELTDLAQGFDSEGPTGVLNWHWDWNIQFGGTYQNGTYRVKVTNSNGKCSSMSAPFRLMYPRKWVEMPQKNIYASIYQIDCGWVYCTYSNWHSLAWSMGYLRFNVPEGVKGPPDHAMVGVSINHYPNLDGTGLWTHDNAVVRSLVKFNSDLYWYKKIGTIKQARLIIKRKWKVPDPGITPCLGGVALLDTNPDFPGYVQGLPPSLSGTVPVNSSQGDTWEVDLTQKYTTLIGQGKPDYGIILYASKETAVPRVEVKSHIRNAEGYDLILRVNVEANQYGSW